MWIVESELGKEESGRMRGVVAMDDKKVFFFFNETKVLMRLENCWSGSVRES